MKYIKRNPTIYILSGKAQSGKNELANILEDIIGKKTIQLAFSTPLKEYAKNILNWNLNEEKPRTFLQELGIDLIKNNIDNKFLIKRMIDDIKVYSYFYDVIIITDARFKEEIEDIRNNFPNTITIRINSRENNLTNVQKKHITETALDDYDKYDYVIDNYYNLEILRKQAEKIVGGIYE